jgi:hypothetical protein
MREFSMPRRKPKATTVLLPAGLPDVPFVLDLIPIDQAKARVISNILRVAKLRPKSAIYLLDPLERVFGPYLAANEILQHKYPDIYVRAALDHVGCNWNYWQNLGEA